MLELEKQFSEDIAFLLDDCEESFLNLSNEAKRPEELDKIFRVAHSIKGSASAIGLVTIAEFAHQVEDCLATLRDKPQLISAGVVSLLLQAVDEFRKYIGMLCEKKHLQWSADDLKVKIIQLNKILQSSDAAQAVAKISDNTVEKETSSKDSAPVHANTNSAIKMDASRVDSVLNLVGELVVIKSQMLQAFFDADSSNTKENALLTLFEKTVRELQDQAMGMRMTAIKPVFVRVQRIMRDLSISLDKPIDVMMEGEDLEVDRTMIDLLTDPLIHIVRNSLDHGIEPSAVRLAAQKPKSGTIRLCAKAAGGRVVIEISDDGAGISREKVLKRAIERNLVRAGVNPQALTDAEVYEFLFMPGFSTAEKVTDLSGRGVGLDVVKSNVHKLKGSVELTSTQGKGSTFKISLPLTTAITDGVVAVVEGVQVILPIDEIVEIIDIRGKNVTKICDKHQIIKIRDSLIPIFQIGEVIRHSGMELTDFQIHESADIRKSETVIIMRGSGEPFGIIVTALIGQNQVVVKPLGPTFESGNGLSGVAILGDGKLGLVLDIGRISQLVLGQKENYSNAEAQSA